MNNPGYHGPWVCGWVNDLAAGEDPDDLAGKWQMNTFHSKRRYLMHLLPFEAFRCLIDSDEAGGQRVAAALAAICWRFSEHRDQWTETDNWQSIYQILSSDAIGLTHEFTDNEDGQTRFRMSRLEGLQNARAVCRLWSFAAQEKPRK